MHSLSTSPHLLQRLPSFLILRFFLEHYPIVSLSLVHLLKCLIHPAQAIVSISIFIIQFNRTLVVYNCSLMVPHIIKSRCQVEMALW
jgi:hypothetical protein